MNVSDLFSALADPTRLRVLEMLHERSRPVHELAAAFDISRPAISRHLRVLKEAGLVREVKKGRENVYSLQAQKLQPASALAEGRTKRARRKGRQARGERSPGRSPSGPRPRPPRPAKTGRAAEGAARRPPAAPAPATVVLRPLGARR